MNREPCSICGQDPFSPQHKAHTREERRPGEPCVAAFVAGERVAFDCPYCGTAHGTLDQGWVPEDLPRRVYAECCKGGWYTLEAREQTRPARPHRTARRH